ncbi:MAG TPA: Rrf2 family transcriptional regulator [bacterium]|nr:Rrf2 family transcriptional regulator [bacterium]
MKLSRESEYGLVGLVYLARQRAGTVMAVKAIAAAEALPAMFLAKTFSRLARHGILRSYRGRRRGYQLARSAREISVREILEGIEGPDLFTHCVFWSKSCSEERPCALHETWKAIRPQARDLASKMTLADCAEDRASHAEVSPVAVPSA